MAMPAASCPPVLEGGENDNHINHNFYYRDRGLLIPHGMGCYMF
jgi:hypothetical protein